MLRWLAWLITPQRRPLSAVQPQLPKQDTPLGMEALDMAEINRVNRANHALERVNAPRTRRFAALESADTHAAIDFADDETYASRFHAAFQSKDTKE